MSWGHHVLLGELSSLSLIILILVPLMMFFSKGDHPLVRCGPRIGALLILSLVLVLFVGFFVFASYRREAEPVLPSYPSLSLLHTEKGATELVATNEELWNRLTESRINLETKDTEAPTGEVPSESETTSESEKSPRPDWIDKPPKRVGNVYRTVVSSDPFSSEDECFEQLEKRFPKEVQKQLQRIVPNDQQSLIDDDSLAGVGISLSFIMKDICRESFTETVDSSVGQMKKVHVLMEFTPAVEKHLQQAWSAYQRRDRLETVAGLAAMVLFALAVAYGLLQFDTWTRGYYTKRLLFGVPAAIIAIVTVLNLF